MNALALGSHILSFEKKPLVMGILNITSDSFYKKSRVPDIASAVSGALQMCADGADIIDIGAESTRPGSQPVSLNEEQNRLIPVLKALRAEIDLPITIDTRNSSTAKLALELGANGINDISAGDDPEMFSVCAEAKCGLILMHMQNNPENMQDNPEYDSVVNDVQGFLFDRAEKAEAAGVANSQIIVDPGVGFGKTLEHNLKLINNLSELNGRPVLLGASRKSFIGMIDGSDVESRIGGSLAAAATAFYAKTAIVRVHDVKETVQLLNTLSAINS